jgi:hypothetical protein
MRAVHWTSGAQRERDPTGFLLWRTECGRWVLLSRTAAHALVTCKQCIKRMA